MNTIKKISVFFGSALCLIGIGIVTFGHNSTVRAADTAVPYRYGVLEKMYGMHFIPAALPSSIGISKDKALNISDNSSYLLGSPSDAIFGYLTTDTKGNAVMVPPRDAAYAEGHGYVTKYPVWLVRNTVANVPILGPGPHNNSNVTRGTIKSQTESMYEFIDATNGQVFFSVSVPNK